MTQTNIRSQTTLPQWQEFPRWPPSGRSSRTSSQLTTLLPTTWLPPEPFFRCLRPQREDSCSLKEQFPTIQWFSAGSSSQYRNGQAENFVRFLKQWVKGVFNLKPGTTSLPKFTSEGLLLVLTEAKNFLNSRPLGWFSRSQGDTVITPNHFLTVYSDPRVWDAPKGLEDRYSQLEDYRSRMFDELRLLMQSSNFLPCKWYSQKMEPTVGDYWICKSRRS